MLSRRAILSIQYTAAGPKAGKAVGGFLRYVHYRDHHNLGERDRGVGGLVRYVAYRDSAAPEGRLFDATKTVSDRERRELTRYLRRSLAGLPDINPVGNRRPARAVYRFVLSPEDARGLDLRQLTRTTMGQHERDTGGLPPWIAAEHRNTEHPHVHIVLAARRQAGNGAFREVRVTKQRLARMKGALSLEIDRQRGERPRELSLEDRLLEMSRGPIDRERKQRSPEFRSRLAPHDPLRRQSARRLPHRAPALRLRRVFARMGQHYRREVERETDRRGWSEEREREMDRGETSAPTAGRS